MSFTVLDGIEKPSPIEPESVVAMAVLMPMSSPSPLTSAPPELPELMAASVWMRPLRVELDWPAPPPCSPETVMDRSRAETMPVVTVPSRPSGEPIATAMSPTCTALESAKVTGVRSSPPFTWMTARSWVASVATMVASLVVPSEKRTSTDCAPSTTWLLVTM